MGGDAPERHVMLQQHKRNMQETKGGAIKSMAESKPRGHMPPWWHTPHLLGSQLFVTPISDHHVRDLLPKARHDALEAALLPCRVGNGPSGA